MIASFIVLSVLSVFQVPIDFPQKHKDRDWQQSEMPVLKNCTAGYRYFFSEKLTTGIIGLLYEWLLMK